MSWYVKTVGAPADVAVEINKVSSIPDAIKSSVASLCSAPLPSDCVVFVETQGHHDGTVGINQGSKVILEVLRSSSPVVKTAP